jgi:hypothetical protein
MSKKSYSDIEQIVKNAAEAYEPAFDEQAWKKMEALLDKDEDRRRPFIFWLWWLLPLLMGAGVLSYFTFNKSEKEKELTIQKNNNPAGEKIKNNSLGAYKNSDIPGTKSIALNNNELTKNDIDNTTSNVDKINNVGKTSDVIKTSDVGAVNNYKTYRRGTDTKKHTAVEALFSSKKTGDKAAGKTKATITPASPVSGDEKTEVLAENSIPGNSDKSKKTEAVNANSATVSKPEESIVIKINADKVSEKEIEKIVDSVITKSVTDKKTRTKISKFYIIVAAGAEASGVKLFSADKITGRAGLAVGYQINKNISIQTGFFVSNKKYIAGKEDYKTKEGSYWNIVDIKSIDANCRVYEIPLQVRYDFTPGKKLNIFATAGLSSYIMQKEDYEFYYERYGTLHQAAVKYTGNKNLFSVLRLSAGAEKKISRQFAVFASPGIAVPLAGVGDGKVKLYSTDIILGLKFTPGLKKK